jgi:hypothetical protein
MNKSINYMFLCWNIHMNIRDVSIKNAWPYAQSIRLFPFLLFTYYFDKVPFFLVFLNESLLSLEKTSELRLFVDAIHCLTEINGTKPRVISPFF